MDTGLNKEQERFKTYEPKHIPPVNKISRQHILLLPQTTSPHALSFSHMEVLTVY